MSEVRLSEHDLKVIKAVFQEVFAPGDELWLFGSRADLKKRGGDIDLYIETSIQNFDAIYNKENKMTSMIWDQIGEQRIDIVVKRMHIEKSLLIHEVARKTGVRLV